LKPSCGAGDKVSPPRILPQEMDLASEALPTTHRVRNEGTL
jgi:hypothetical protein